MVDNLEDPDPLMLLAEDDEIRSLANETVSRMSVEGVKQSRRKEPQQMAKTVSALPPALAGNGDEEELVICGRFPHMDVCACDIQCQIALREINLFEVYPGILMGPYQAGFKT